MWVMWVVGLGARGLEITKKNPGCGLATLDNIQIVKYRKVYLGVSGTVANYLLS